MTAGGDAKSMSAIQSGSTSGPNLCHLLESVPRRSTIVSKSKFIGSPGLDGPWPSNDLEIPRMNVTAAGSHRPRCRSTRLRLFCRHGDRPDRRLPHDVPDELPP